MPQVNTITITKAQIIDYKYDYLKKCDYNRLRLPRRIMVVLFLDR